MNRGNSALVGYLTTLAALSLVALYIFYAVHGQWEHLLTSITTVLLVAAILVALPRR